MIDRRLLQTVAVLCIGCAGGAAAQKPTPDPAAGEVLARLGDGAVTRAEVDARIQGRLVQLRQQEYDLRREALESLLDERLVDQEAAERGISPEELVRQEVELKTSPASPKQVEEFYAANRSGMGGRSFEEVRAAIEKGLTDENRSERAAEFRRALRRKAGVKVLLEPPRHAVPVPPGAPAVGPDDAPITIVEFTDYQCPYCRRAEPVVQRVLDAYPGQVKLVFRDFPLSFHERAMPAARAVHCAAEQGRFWDFHRGLFDSASDFSDADFKRRAQKLGLDSEAFESCYASDRYDTTIRSAIADGAALGVTGTPTFFVNGRMLVGARPFEDFRRIIDEELERRGD